MRERARDRDRAGGAPAAAEPEVAVPARAPGAVEQVLAEPGEPLGRAALLAAARTFDFSRISVLPPARERLAVEAPGAATEREAEAVAAAPRPAAAAVVIPPPELEGVRLHTGRAAERAAASVGAAAFSVGRDVVLGAGGAGPPGGADALLAHELVHVVQHARGDGTPVVRRRSFLQNVGIFFGLVEGTFEDKELRDYLAGITRSRRIEDAYDSDNKARAVVGRWLAGAAGFQLTAPQMVLLIREMASGWVGDADQGAILDLLENAQSGDLRLIFAPGEIDPKRLAGDFGGALRARLIDLYDLRFRGGTAALYGGTVEPLSGPPATAPVFQWDWSFFRAKLEEPAYHDEELAAELKRLPGGQRDRALADLTAQRLVLQRALIALFDKYNAESDATKKEQLKDAGRVLARKRQRVDTVLQTAFKDIAMAEPAATLLAGTHTPTAAEKAEIAKALVPDVRTLGGAPAPFRRQIPGEAERYDDKIRALMPGLVQGYWDRLVKDKGAAEHADPTKVHALVEFEPIANAAKDATDRVFGAYYSAAAHPAFRADRPPPVGRGQLHDLFADMQARLAAMGPTAKRILAKRLVFYFFQTNGDIQTINRHHDANPRFSGTNAPLNLEATLLEGIATWWVGPMDHVRKLNEIDRNWEATASTATHEVNLQIFRKPTPEEDRRFLWDTYQIMIHEYLHTLVHPDYVTFADSFGASSLQNNTLMEGVDTLLDEIVWQDARTRITSPAVRAKVEGPLYSGLPFDPAAVPEVFNRRYPSYAQAMKLVQVVGIRNVLAAYFLGKVELIKP